MQTVEEKLIWIANFAINTDAALKAEIGFVGAAKAGELDPSVVDELELFSLGFNTKLPRNGDRIFGVNRSLDDTVQKVLGFDFDSPDDNGTSGGVVSLSCKLRSTNLFGPAICENLVRDYNILLCFTVDADILDNDNITLAAFGSFESARCEPIQEMLDETELSALVDDAVLRLKLLHDKCLTTKDYSPFDDVVRAWDQD